MLKRGRHWREEEGGPRTRGLHLQVGAVTCSRHVTLEACVLRIVLVLGKSDSLSAAQQDPGFFFT